MSPNAPSSVDEARERLSNQIFSARTITEIMDAEIALRQWLYEHPDEPGMTDGFEVLSHMRDFAEWLEANPDEAKIVEARRRVLNRIDGVRSLVDIPAAREVLHQFLCDYPQEDMNSETTFLSLLEEAYTVVEQEDQIIQEPRKTPAHV
jgi:hypothetical protein